MFSCHFFSESLSVRYGTIWRESGITWLYLNLYWHYREPSGWRQHLQVALLCGTEWVGCCGCGTLHSLLSWFYNRGSMCCSSLLSCQPSKALVAYIPFIFHILVSKYEWCPGFQDSYPTVPNTPDGLYGINVDRWDSLWFNNLSLKFIPKIWSDKSYPATLSICCQGCVFIACYFYI